MSARRTALLEALSQKGAPWISARGEHIILKVLYGFVLAFRTWEAKTGMERPFWAAKCRPSGDG